MPDEILDKRHCAFCHASVVLKMLDGSEVVQHEPDCPLHPDNLGDADQTPVRSKP